jgi:hypothetical protein
VRRDFYRLDGSIDYQPTLNGNTPVALELRRHTALATPRAKLETTPGIGKTQRANSMLIRLAGRKPIRGVCTTVVETLWKRCGNVVETLWKRCGNVVETLWKRCGNVVEWCRDWYQEGIPGGRNPEVVRQSALRTARGGGWAGPDELSRSGFRWHGPPNSRNDRVGFRIVAIQVEANAEDPFEIQAREWTKPVPLTAINSNARDNQPAQSTDGLTLVFASVRAGGQGGCDLWMSMRPNREAEFRMPVNMGSVVNSSHWESDPVLSADGFTLFFGSGRPGGRGLNDLWMSSRENLDAPFGQPTNLGIGVNSFAAEHGPSVTADGLTLVFARGYLPGELWISERTSVEASFGIAKRLGQAINRFSSGGPAISSDGLTLLFHSNRKSGFGNNDLWKSTRLSRDVPFRHPVNFGPVINGPKGEKDPTLSTDGNTLFYVLYDRDQRDIWMSQRIDNKDPLRSPRRR